MGIEAWLSPLARTETGATTALINARLQPGGMSITAEEARMLAASRTELLTEAERVEFGTPAIVEIAAAVATSSHLSQSNVAETLFELQGAFYAIRDELPADVPDAEIVEALRGCLDTWGDTATITSMPAEEVMRFSAEYARAEDAGAFSEYRITDDEGRTRSPATSTTG